MLLQELRAAQHAHKDMCATLAQLYPTLQSLSAPLVFSVPRLLPPILNHFKQQACIVPLEALTRIASVVTAMQDTIVHRALAKNSTAHQVTTVLDR